MPLRTHQCSPPVLHYPPVWPLQWQIAPPLIWVTYLSCEQSVRYGIGKCFLPTFCSIYQSDEMGPEFLTVSKATSCSHSGFTGWACGPFCLRSGYICSKTVQIPRGLYLKYSIFHCTLSWWKTIPIVLILPNNLIWSLRISMFKLIFWVKGNRQGFVKSPSAFENAWNQHLKLLNVGQYPVEASSSSR